MANAWQTLLVIQMQHGKYLSSKLPDENHWLRLWVLMVDAYPGLMVATVKG